MVFFIETEQIILIFVEPQRTPYSQSDPQKGEPAGGISQLQYPKCGTGAKTGSRGQRRTTETPELNPCGCGQLT